MNADPAAVQPVTVPSGIVTEALYFPADAKQLFGWLHWPAARHRCDLGMVICKPFGYEALCAHRSLRAFAHMAAANGVPALNFDYAGTGDSADIAADHEQLERWCHDVITAVAELRRHGVGRVSLLGFRLGALLALLAARRVPIDALILVSPILSGNAYLRELRTLQAMAARRADAPNSTSEGWRQVLDATDGSLEVGGYRLAAQTLSRLGEIDLDTPGKPPASAVLVIDRVGLPAARGWAQSVSGHGVPVDYLAMPGFVEMMMTPPPFTRTPHAMIGCVREWLLRVASTSAVPAPAPPDVPRGGTPASSSPPSANDGMATEDTPVERPVQFGADGLLFGIITEPYGDAPPRRAVVFVNAGADSHVCIGRLYVALARRWAGSGCVVLRMDLAGLGDSHTRPGRPDNEVYPPAAIDDMRAAVEFMRTRYRVSDVALAGLCSGAYHVLRAAAASVPVSRILMVNPETYFWREGTPLEDIQVSEVVRGPDLYRHRSRSLHHWKKLLTGQVDVRRIVTVAGLRLLLHVQTRARDLLRVVHVRLPNDLGWELLQLAKRGVDITFVFAGGEPGLELLRMQGGRDLDRLGERCRIHTIESADHTFSRSASRAVLEQVLSEALLTQRGVRVAAP
jgi:alpha-beta hydrolase superfamily lysophospholipase